MHYGGKGSDGKHTMTRLDNGEPVSHDFSTTIGVLSLKKKFEFIGGTKTGSKGCLVTCFFNGYSAVVENVPGFLSDGARIT